MVSKSEYDISYNFKYKIDLVKKDSDSKVDKGMCDVGPFLFES